jgi:hypothetical protein
MAPFAPSIVAASDKQPAIAGVFLRGGAFEQVIKPASIGKLVERAIAGQFEELGIGVDQ